MGSIIDETGKQYGYWTVIKRLPRDKTTGGVRWLCRCKCGTEKSISGTELRRGRTKSCGCAKKNNIIGQQFGKLKVLQEDSSNKQNCSQHSIPLIRIPYTKLGQITLEDLIPETSIFLYVGGDNFDTPCTN